MNKDNRSFWEEIKDNNKEEIQFLLIKKLGEPEKDNRMANYLLKKISSMFATGFQSEENKETESRFVGNLKTVQAKIISIEQRKEKEKSLHAGEVFYSIFTDKGEKFSIRKYKVKREDIWEDVVSGACINKIYLIKYTKWIKNLNIISWERVKEDE